MGEENAGEQHPKRKEAIHQRFPRKKTGCQLAIHQEIGKRPEQSYPHQTKGDRGDFKVKMADEVGGEKLHRRDPGEHEEKVDHVDEADLFVLNRFADVMDSSKGVDARMPFHRVGFFE